MNNEELNALIEYQKLDTELKKLKNNLDNSAAARDKEKAKTAFNDAKARLAACEQNAEKILASYENCKKYVSENEAAFSGVKAPDENADDAEVKDGAKTFESYKNKFSHAERKLNECLDAANKVLADYKEAFNRGKVMRDKYAAAKKQYDDIAAELSPKISELEKKLAATRGKIDDSLYGKYEERTSNGLFPPIVPADYNDKQQLVCAGCGMGQSQQNNAELEENGYCTCESCRRIIIRK